MKLQWLLFSPLLTLIWSCASVPMAPLALDVAAKQFHPLPGQAQVYIVRDGFLGTAVTYPVLLDGQMRGTLPIRSYLLLSLPPGQHLVTSFTSENQENLALSMEAGQNYFVRLFGKWGWITGRVGLELLDDVTGRQAVIETERIEGLDLALTR